MPLKPGGKSPSIIPLPSPETGAWGFLNLEKCYSSTLVSLSTFTEKKNKLHVKSFVVTTDKNMKTISIAIKYTAITMKTFKAFK